MSQNVEAEYDSLLAEITSKLGKIDIALAMQTMYFERKFTDVEPHVELHIQYGDGVNLDQKKAYLAAKYGYLIAKEGKDALRTTGLMTLRNIIEISADKDVEEITGTATCASY